MKLYADTPARRTRQVVGDVLVALWVVLAVWVGLQVHDGFGAVADQVDRVEAAGTSLSGGLSDAGATLEQAPFIGEEIASPFASAAGSSDDIAQAGADTAESVRSLGFWLGVAVALVLALLVLPWWLVGRVRFVVLASLVDRFRHQEGDQDLLALRALTRQPVARLVRRHPGAVRGWREGDRATIAALAALELRELGLAPGPAGRP